MADALTYYIGLIKPEVGGSDDMWGEKLNSNFDKLDLGIGTGALNNTPSKIYVDDADALRLLKSGGTMTGVLLLFANPTAALEAATKQYVDLRVAKAGDTMTGHLALPVGPAAANAVRKDYVDAADATKVAKTGDTMTGTLIVAPPAIGQVGLVGGTTNNPGYVQFLTADGTRRGYVGWHDGSTRLVFNTETGWGLAFNASSFLYNAQQVTTNDVMQAADALKLNLTGGTLSGHLVLPITPAASNAVRKDYVDAALQAAIDAQSVQFDNAQSLSAGQQTQVRSNIGFTRASVDSAYGEYTVNADLTATTPIDDTIPQITEGTQIISVSITPKAATNRIRASFLGTVCAGVGEGITAALFRNGGSNAIASAVQSVPASSMIPLPLIFEDSPGSTSLQTYTLRVGSYVATFRMNGNTSGRVYGGTLRSCLVLEEFTP